ncbi:MULTISPECIES: formylmethanofuran dehydrogenase subunit C [unclassified Thioalkalivibrio]|uniref:formylmethanofuran dehydrogenase subunit C n=1 Tax=unclassified Thioalkalivibrio TaxID=2621013 RepID=UPI000370DA0D|nr:MULTISPECIES: formylmethanofuran dehydrogenase subunit C [unclassified Thioalkalivibrio]
MSALVLEQRVATPQRLDMSPMHELFHERSSVDAAQRLTLRCGRDPIQLGDVFDVTRGHGDKIVIKTSANNLDRVGAGMSQGELIVEGDVGHHTGAQMTGGRINILGHAGDFTASALHGGRIEITGDCGAGLGAPAPGLVQGMSGGFVHVRGNCAPRAGERQRRGIILVEGNAGSELGAGMIAGTLIVLGETGDHPGREMRRGTLLLDHMPKSLPVTFTDNGIQPLGFLAVLCNELERLQVLPATWTQRKLSTRRFIGDLACSGKGEVLVWT